MRQTLIAASRGFLDLSLEGYGCDEFPDWLRRTFYRTARVCENAIGLLEDGPWGMLAVMLQHRNHDRSEREHFAELERYQRECLAQAA